ncbi:hypothetical protein C8Q80DRAFT_1207395 [Daedaleopsis nitida]|nr:hypothetical protein C8Q80DRAFT_1207395 [Daedaleopsis nitida]
MSLGMQLFLDLRYLENDLTGTYTHSSEPEPDELPSRRQRNRNHILHRLPNELLIELFEHIHTDVFLSELSTTDDEWNHLQGKARGRRWLILLKVCRRWRALLLRTRRFWRIVHVYRRPNWLQYCLSLVHGSNAPLHIHFHNSTFSPSYLSLLRPHLKNISVLTFQANPQWAHPLRSL